MSSRRKIKIKVLVFILGAIIISSVLWCGRVFSYSSSTTHPSLTGDIAKIFNKNFEKKLSEQEIEWLKKGSIEEDFGARWRYHFYSANKNIGLGPWVSSRIWVDYWLGQIEEATGDQTWQKAINSYAKGDNKSAFIALGHILHLMEDMTVPAHTRLDPHPFGEPYEDWASKNFSVNLEGITVSHLGNLGEYFYVLSKYSNNNFFSQNTVLKNNDLVVLEKFNKLFGRNTYNCVKGNQGQCLLLVKKDVSGDAYYFDSPVHSDYFSLLAPKAISYGVGVVKLFFDEAEKAKKEYQQKSWWQKLKEGFLASVSSSLATGLPANLVTAIVPSPASPADEIKNETGSLSENIVQYSLPENTVEAQDKIVVNLPENTVLAQEKLDGIIAEETTPDKIKIPSAITEEINPTQASLPKASPSPSPISFLPGIGGSSSSGSSSNSDSDTAAPETTITSAPAAAVATTTAVFIFESSESSSTFLCQLDSATSTVCESPKEYTNLAEGDHNFKVSAKDAVGNEDISPAEHSWDIDLSPPNLSNISSAPTRNLAAISWTNDEAGIFQVEYGVSTSYGLLSATTSASSINLSELTPATTYHFRLLAEDNLANATTSSDYIFVTSSQAENVVISEIQISGATATDEFVELYNPTSVDINLEGWKLARRLATATSSYSNLLSSFPNKTIPAKGYFLIAHPTGYDGGVLSDAVYSSASYSLTSNNAVILYSDAGDTIVDLVGLGTALSFESVATDSPANNKSVERKSCATSTATTLYSGEHKWQGSGYDSDNNSADFVLQEVSAPQNSLMLTEPRSVLPNLATASVWPTWQKNLMRTGQSGAASLASSTLSVKWTATTTATHEFSSRPVLDSEGNIYIGRNDGLAKYSSGGEFLWLYATSTSHSVPIVLNDDSIVFRGDWGLFAVNSQGQQKWKYSLSGTSGKNFPPIILSDGTLITQSAEKIYAINQDATLKWIFDPGRAMSSSDSFSAPVVDAVDNIYFVLDNYLYAIDKNGVKLWERNDGSYSGLTMGSDNNIYISYQSIWPSGGFLALDKNNGNILWRDENGYNNLPYLAPVIDENNKVYQIMFFGNGDKKLQMYNATSTPSWSVNLANVNLAAPILTSDGKIYVTDQKALKIFDVSDGALLANFNTEDSQDLYNYFGAVGNNGTIYTANGTTLYALDD